MEVSIERSTGGSGETVASAFTHLNNAWHDSGAHFSNISLPINSHVKEEDWNQLILLKTIADDSEFDCGGRNPANYPGEHRNKI